MWYPSPVSSLPPHPLDLKVLLTNFCTWISNSLVIWGFLGGVFCLLLVCLVGSFTKQPYALTFLWGLVLVNVHVFDILEKYSLFVALKLNNSGLLPTKTTTKGNWTLGSLVPEDAFILYQLSLQEKLVGLCQKQSGRVFLLDRKERGLAICVIT